jgi:DNA mismatch repair protein MutS2
VNANTFRTLEFDAIRELLLGHAGSARGRELVSDLLPATEAAEVRSALAATTEGVRLLDRIGRQPYHQLPDVADVLPVVRVSGVHLEARALSDVAAFAEGALEIAQRVSALEELPRHVGLAEAIPDLSEVTVAIRRAILPTGEVADDASPKLAETRRALSRLRSQLQSVMDSYLHDRDAERLLQDRLITTRNDRHVLLVKAEHRGALPGVVHGSSGSGASLFIEPMPAVEINNDIVALSDDERREVVRILRDLTSRVGRHADALERAVLATGELDAIQARALLARDMAAVEPVITTEMGLDLREARHPLLMESLTSRLGMPTRTRGEPVPVSIRFGFGSPVIVISGPNTGGKTVTLKTAGLLALMAQCGLHVPAAEGSTLPVFQRVFADIGDDQSIAANLSTFSAHLANVVSMARELRRPSLVLLDEVGAGTDPQEGGALGVALVENFRQRGALVMATTHHGLLKNWALQTEGVISASFGYDPQTFEPTYRLTIGTPGRSLALEMAERLGLPAEVVRDARERLDRRDADVEELLKQLEQARAEAAAEREGLASQRTALEDQRAQLAAAEREVRSRKREVIDAFQRELKKRSEEATRQASAAIRETVAKLEASKKTAPGPLARSKGELTATLRRVQADALAGVAEETAAPEPVSLAPIQVGSRAKVKSLGVVGTVMSLDGDAAELAVSGKRLRVSRDELVALAGSGGSGGGVQVSVRAPRAAARESSRVEASAKEPTDVAAELVIIGKTVDEAMPEVEQFIDEAALAGRKEIRIVHGFGTGRLRQAVQQLVKGHPQVARHRLGGPGEGGGGATVVELSD